MVAGVAAHPVPDPVVAAIHRLTPEGHITSLTSGPMPGFVTAIVDRVPLYVSTDGRFVLQGHLYDLARGVDVSAMHTAAERMAMIHRFPASDFITISPAHARYHVTAFVDTDCPYCQQLVNGLDGYLAQGIAISFASYPRAGLGSDPAYIAAEKIWCSRDRATALRLAFSGHAQTATVCPNPVAREYGLARKLDLAGTPTIIASDGAIVGGLMTPVELRQRLADLALQDRAAASP
jgi:thiol:disulfide interchange protein DsbC